MLTDRVLDLKMLRTTERGMGKGTPQTHPLRHISRRETGQRATGSQGPDRRWGMSCLVLSMSRHFELGEAAELQPRWRLYQWALSGMHSRRAGVRRRVKWSEGVLGRLAAGNRS